LSTRLYLVRHGSTELAEEGRFVGTTDVRLSSQGLWESECLAERLKTERLDAIYTSPLSCAAGTASIVAAFHNAEPVQRYNLKEAHFGQWEGLRRTEVERDFKSEYGSWLQDPFTIAPPGGESGLNALNRVLPGVRRLIDIHRDQSIAVVSHEGINKLLICALLGLDLKGYRDRLDQSPAALNIMDFETDTSARLGLFNDTSHYVAMPTRTPSHPHLPLGDHRTAVD
jgi:probable phosphoglycerate mutase